MALATRVRMKIFIVIADGFAKATGGDENPYCHDNAGGL